MRLGIYGGSFDPVHYGHLLLAESCREQARLDEVWFVPAAQPPHKRPDQLSEARHRVEMLQLAIGGHEPFHVSTCEVDRGGLSYTVDTLAQIAGEQPAYELFLLLGSDSLADLPRWREPARICALATPLAVRRPGSPAPDYDGLAGLVSADRLESFRRQQVDMPRIEISGSDLRRRVAAGMSIRFRTPRAVEKYIETAGLYRQP